MSNKQPEGIALAMPSITSLLLGAPLLSATLGVCSGSTTSRLKDYRLKSEVCSSAFMPLIVNEPDTVLKRTLGVSLTVHLPQGMGIIFNCQQASSITLVPMSAPFRLAAWTVGAILQCEAQLRVGQVGIWICGHLDKSTRKLSRGCDDPLYLLS